MKKVFSILLALILFAWLAQPGLADTPRKKISELDALTAPVSTDVLPIVSGGITKKIDLETLFRGVPDGTESAPGWAFADEPGTGFNRIGAGNVGLNLTGVKRVDFAIAGPTFILPDDTLNAGLAVSNTDGWLKFYNGTATADQFRPVLGTLSKGTAHGLHIWNKISAGDDSGTYPVMRFVATLGDSADPTVRPLFAWQNYTKTLLEMSAQGVLGLGVTPKGWSSDYAVLQLGALASLFSYKSTTAGRTTFLASNAYFDTSWKHIENDEATYLSTANGGWTFGAAAAGAADSAISWQTFLTMQLGGALIAYHNNASRLQTTSTGIQVEGYSAQIDILGTTASIIDFLDGNPADFDGRILYNHTSRDFQFYTIQALRLTLDGNRAAFTVAVQPKHVNDAGMAATDGSAGDFVFNDADLKAYVCTATGTPGTWAALN